MSAENSVVSVEEKLMQLRSSDGEIFQVAEKVASLSVTIKNLVEDGCADSVVPMPNVTAKTLAKVIEYCKHHVEAAAPDTEANNNKAELDAFDAEFTKVETRELFDLMLAANYMNIKGLLDLTCQKIADTIKDMSVEEVRKLFNIINDFTPEEEQAIREENAWAFE